tara:strand:- start:286 stop:438 length:153 start_codon:yes stop_codon:yes gene_type:complete
MLNDYKFTEIFQALAFTFSTRYQHKSVDYWIFMWIKPIFSVGVYKDIPSF